MRSYALVILDNFDNIIDRYALDLVTEPTGNGFELELSTITTDIRDIITYVRQKKIIKTFVVQQIYDSYQKAINLTNWIQKYSTTDYIMALEYKDGVSIYPKYCEGKVISLSKTEKSNNITLPQTLQFQMTTPDFIKETELITIAKSTEGKEYPYTYPYSYGDNSIENNSISNEYLFAIPLIIEIDGVFNSVQIDLYSYTIDQNGQEIIGTTFYNRVSLPNLNLTKRQKLVINSAQSKMILYTYADEEKTILVSAVDISPQVDPNYDTFLFAQKGLSKIIVNDENIGDGFNLKGTWRRYTL